ncbi:MAG: hypothetical protein Q4F25_06680, partial [Eubacteriales bacterium]|nr:hypothetical protein [Eubacteriales bacterium]
REPETGAKDASVPKAGATDTRVPEMGATEARTPGTDRTETRASAMVAAEKTGLGRFGGFLMTIAAAGLFLSVCGIVLLFTKAFFHSDSAFYVQLALEQLRSGKLFPPGMYYSTVLFVRSPNLILLPLLSVMEDWMLAREVMVIIMWAGMLFAVFYCFTPGRDRRFSAALIAALLLMNPYMTEDVANETTDMLFFQGAYVTIFFDVILTLGIINRILYLKKEDKAIRKAELWIALAVVVFLPLLGSVRMDMILTLPLAAALLAYYFIENGESVARTLRTKRCIGTVILIAAVVCAGYLSYRFLAVRYWNESKGEFLKMGKYSDVWSALQNLVNNLTIIFGNVNSAVFLSFPGLTKFINYFYELVLMIIVPVVAVFKYRKFESRFTRFLVVYTWISNLLVAGVFVACHQWAPRYLLTIYLDDILLLSAMASEYMKKRERLTALTLGLVIVMYCACCHVYFWGHYKDRIGVNPNEELISFLEEHDLHYGYASFWNASVNTVLSNGEVQVVPLWDYDAENGVRKPYNPQSHRSWLGNEQWYDVGSHPGRCFMLLENKTRDNEEQKAKWDEEHGLNAKGKSTWETDKNGLQAWTDPTPPETIEERFYSLKPETLTVGDYTILVFESNEAVQALAE